jgi:hypothetical protein
MSTRRTGRTLALAGLCAALAACSLRSPHATESSCNRDAECGQGRVCFANECRSPASALGGVMVEVTPPTSSPYAPVQRSLDLKASAVGAIELPLPSHFQGKLLQDSDADGGAPGSPVALATLEFHDARAVIPGRAFNVTVQSDPTGDFSVRLPPSTWALRITPPPPLPPFQASVGLGNAEGVVLKLPAASRLARVRGTLKLGGQPLVGARVTPVDSGGVPVGAPATSDSSGQLTLFLPPPPIEYLLRVSDSPDGGATVGGGPIPSFDDSAFGVATATATSSAISLDLGKLPAPATLSGTVVDESGSPVQAHVTAASEDGAGWVLTRSTTSAADGSFALPLREGRYLLEAAPSLDPGQPALSGESEVLLSASAAPVRVVCPRKLRAAGLVLRSGGTAIGPGAAVSATRLPGKLVGSRTATTTATDIAGRFTLIGDPGLYRVEVVPQPDSGEPRQLAFVQVSAAPGGATEVTLDPIQLSPPVTIVGTVQGPSNGTLAPVAGVSVDVFAVNAAGDGAVRLGSGITDSAGRYRLVLPDVSEPAAMAPAR